MILYTEQDLIEAGMPAETRHFATQFPTLEIEQIKQYCPVDICGGTNLIETYPGNWTCQDCGITVTQECLIMVNTPVELVLA